MALDRWIALVLLGICLVYGYAAWFTMDDALAPFMRRNPIWPSTFPKVLAIVGMIASFLILLGIEKDDETPGDIDYRRLTDYKLGQAIIRVFHTRRTLLAPYAADLNHSDGHRLVSCPAGLGHFPAPLAYVHGGLNRA